MARRAGLFAVFGRRDGWNRRARYCITRLLAARPTNRAAEKFRLLVRLSRQTISCGPFATAGRKPTLGSRFGAAYIGGRRYRTFKALLPIPLRAITVWAIPIGTVTVGPVSAVEAIRAIGPIRAVMTVTPIEAPVALEGAIAVAITRPLVLVALFAMRTLRTIFVAALAGSFLEARLFALARQHRRLITGAITTFVAVHVGTHAAFGTMLAIVAGVSATLADLLLTVGHDDAIIVLGMLEIILRQHRVTGRLGIARQRHIFLGDVGGCTAQFHIGTVAFETPRERILAFALLIVLIVVAAAASAVLLSLPHGLRSRPVKLFIGLLQFRLPPQREACTANTSSPAPDGDWLPTASRPV